ncbi:MAG: ABC transporter ATP-binding protein [Alphaproteobacteria bacterium]|jgi:ABC-type multidrug transport system fused ATPase/permease subunit|nr:ABC transporter ATP-binding protein [Alphaproteobacteria bacterium]
MSPRAFFDTCRQLGLARSTALAILCLDLVSVLFEGIGIGMILPILDYLEGSGDVGALAGQSTIWRFLVAVFDGLGIEISLPSLLLASLLFLCAGIGFVYGRTVYAGAARFGVIREVRERAFRRYLDTRLSYSEGDELGQAVNDFTTEAERASSCVFQVLTLIGGTILILSYFGLALAVSPPMALAILPIVALAALGVRGMIRKSRDVGEQVTEANQALGSFLVERLKSHRFIRLSGTEVAESGTMKQIARRQYGRYVHVLALGARVAAVVEILGAVAILGFLYFGFIVFELSLGEIGLFLAAILRLMPRVREVMGTRQALVSFVGSLAALQRRFDQMARARESESGVRPFKALHAGIEFQTVSFAYGGANTAALNGIDLTIPSGRITALVGPSGAGKSTLIDLLPLLREPSAGQIFFDGTPQSEFELKSLRAAIAYAPQTPQVFNASAAAHIAYGGAGAARRDIEAAARLAGAHEFIEALPEGYDSPVGEDGVLLSGGQRQRLDLARTLVRGAPILVLDEPTSNLDADAEAAFRAALERIRRETDMTIIVVGHRLSTVAIADQIVIMEAGCVSDTGSHAELLARGGWYASAFAKQQGPVDMNAASDPGEDVK